MQDLKQIHFHITIRPLIIYFLNSFIPIKISINHTHHWFSLVLLRMDGFVFIFCECRLLIGYSYDEYKLCLIMDLMSHTVLFIEAQKCTCIKVGKRKCWYMNQELEMWGDTCSITPKSTLSFEPTAPCVCHKENRDIGREIILLLHYRVICLFCWKYRLLGI